MGVLFAATAVVFLLLYLGPYRNPGWIYSPGFAVSLLLFGFAGFSTGEFIREAVRKPYIIYNYVLGNQVVASPERSKPLKEFGLLNERIWALAYVKAEYPQCVRRGCGNIDWNAVQEACSRRQGPPRRRDFSVSLQRLPRSGPGLLAGGTAGPGVVAGPMIRDLVRNLDKHRFTMPPWCGTSEEADLLTDYLYSIAPQRPTGMLPKPERSPAKSGGRRRLPGEVSPTDNAARKGE